MFFFATAKASLETSASVTLASFTRLAMARPMQPEPQQRSRILGSLSRNKLLLMASSVTAQVSSLGISTSGLT